MVDIRSAIPEYPLIRRVTESQLTSIEKAERNRVEAEKEQNKEPLLALAAHIKKAWEGAYRAKMAKVQELLVQCARQRNGEYDPGVLAELKREGDQSPVYMLLSNIKCRAAESWLRGVELPPGDRPWSLDPTPIPELPPEKKEQITQQIEAELTQYMMEQGFESLTPDMVSERLAQVEKEVLKKVIELATDDADKLETHINDQLVEGDYYRAINDFISDLVTYPGAFLKGPNVRKKKQVIWEKGEDGESVPGVGDKLMRTYYAPSPYDMFPSPGARNIQDGYLVERIKLRRSDLEACIGVPGFSNQAIQGVLQLYGTGGLTEWMAVDQDRADVEGREHEWDDIDLPIDCLEYWGSMQGRKLLEWGMPKEQIRDANKNYFICAWLIGQWVVMARLNPHPLGKRPYFSTCFEKINGNIWGKSVPMLMRDCQKICNAVARAMVRNLGIASGPQTEVSVDRMDPGEDVESQFPWKVWKTRDPMGTGRPAINFFQPSPMTDILQGVYDYFFKQASEQTGIPQYIYGSEDAMGGGSGAGSTASGLSMLMNAATKTMQDVVFQIDSDVITQSIREHWLHVMLFDKDVKKKGDINVVARASEHLIIAEQLQLRLIETLRETNNPVDLAIMGMEGRAVLLRESVKRLKLPSGEVVPDKSTIKAKQQAAEQQAMMQQGPNPAALNPAGGRSGEMVRVNK
uniref:Putative portal protein n=1 Tax=viral metagenome TaxID=1070528 RepID=A0A6H1ZZY4_9ZZZZ